MVAIQQLSAQKRSLSSVAHNSVKSGHHQIQNRPRARSRIVSERTKSLHKTRPRPAQGNRPMASCFLAWVGDHYEVKVDGAWTPVPYDKINNVAAPRFGGVVLRSLLLYPCDSAWSKFRVAIRTREIYHSANGDRWLLARDPNTCRVFVRHEPNLPSGGQVADIEIGAFLIAAGSGPEKQELLRLIGTLV